MVLKILICVFLFLSVVPLRLNFMFYVNLLKNRGAVAVRVYGKSVVQEKFKIADGQVTATNHRNKAKTIDLSLDDESVIFLNNFTKSLLKTLILDNTYVGFEVGKKDDAMATAMISGVMLTVTDLVFAQVFSRKKGSTHQVDSEPLFTTSKLSIAMQNTLYVTLFDVLFSALRGYLIMKKTIKKQKQISVDSQ